MKIKTKTWDEMGEKKYMEAGLISFGVYCLLFIIDKSFEYLLGSTWMSDTQIFLQTFGTFIVYPWLIYKANARTFKPFRWLLPLPIVVVFTAILLWNHGILFTLKGAIGIAFVVLVVAFLLHTLRKFFYDIWYDHVGKYLDGE